MAIAGLELLQKFAEVLLDQTPLGKMDPEAFKRTPDMALKFGVIKKAADAGA